MFQVFMVGLAANYEYCISGIDISSNDSYNILYGYFEFLITLKTLWNFCQLKTGSSLVFPDPKHLIAYFFVVSCVNFF